MTSNTQQQTSFTRVEEFDTKVGQWRRQIKPTRMFNFLASVSHGASTGSNIAIGSTVIGADEFVTIYYLKGYPGGDNAGVSLVINSSTIISATDITGEDPCECRLTRDSPLTVAFAGDTVLLRADSISDTYKTSAGAVVGVIEPEIDHLEMA